MSNTGKIYSEEFRRDAVELLRTSGKPLKPLARELGISDGSLRMWRDKYLGKSERSERGAVGDEVAPEASAKELWDENLRLRQEVTHLKRQREILKKAASILAEDPQLGM